MSDESNGTQAEVGADSNEATESAKRTRRRRNLRPFPGSSFQEALDFAESVHDFGAGQPTRKLTFFNHLGKSPESSASRNLLTNANKYGLIKGSFASEIIELTDSAKRIIEASVSAADVAATKIRLAIQDVEVFSRTYDRFANNRLPAKAALVDAMKELSVPEEYIEEGVDTFILNLRTVGLLRILSGADRIVPVDLAVEHLASEVGGNGPQLPPLSGRTNQDSSGVSRPQTDGSWHDSTCFYITPIGENGSIERKHSDLFLGSIIEPALASFNIKVIRADAIEKPGMITKQIIEHILKSRLVVADLSFHNPNVFYELALRHAIRKPIVQIIRARDRIPFDVGQFRTVVIDDGDVYSFVPKLETYRADVANQVRRALDDEAESDNPLSIYFPSFSAFVSN